MEVIENGKTTGNTRAARLGAFVTAHEAAPVKWGVSDCSAWAAAWVRAETGVRLDMPTWRSADEAHALIAAAGGLDALWRGVLTRAGIVETVEPRLGDVGLIRVSFGLVGAIAAEGGYALWRMRQGVSVVAPRRWEATWALP